MRKEIAPRITTDPTVGFGKPVIAGTRIPVEIIVGKLASGMDERAVAEAYGITIDDVRAGLSYAAELVASEQVRASA